MSANILFLSMAVIPDIFVGMADNPYILGGKD